MQAPAGEMNGDARNIPTHGWTVSAAKKLVELRTVLMGCYALIVQRERSPTGTAPLAQTALTINCGCLVNAETVQVELNQILEDFQPLAKHAVTAYLAMLESMGFACFAKTVSNRLQIVLPVTTAPRARRVTRHGWQPSGSVRFVRREGRQK